MTEPASKLATPLLTVEKGVAHPLGATVKADGVNFSVFSEHATGIDLLLFDDHDDIEPFQTISLDPLVNKTFHFWHVFLENAKHGLHYAIRVDGPNEPNVGHRFDRDKVLIEPYSKGNSKTLWKRVNACKPGDNLATSLRSVVIDTSDYDWEGDQPLKRPLNETVIYELHIGGFTRSPSAGVRQPGTFAGVIEKIPYLKELGVTAVELLPVFEFDDTETREFEGQRLTNYWGYSTMSYFAPHSSYCVNPEIGQHVCEFRDMVKALHKAGIEVILDVVFNHTDEGNHEGPTFSFKGIDNSIYYYLSPLDKRYYFDYTGCGNTFNCNHPIGEKFIIDCLKYWIKEMHVDGFRFDEASVLTRGEDGAPLAYPPVLWDIDLDDDLADAKVIAEAWDAAGLYQIGYFPGYRWGEWNGRYRDDIRRFVKGDAGMISAVATRLSGSADLYQWRGHLPVNSVNFLVAHDGFTLNDLASYNDKHNWANGEHNNDGINENLSWNCGVEGDTDDPRIEALRNRQIKNFATLLMLSQGVPMMVMGDEVRRTQKGNNNAYCQDNEISWFDWSLVEKNKDIFRFWKELIAFRLRHPTVHRSRYFIGAVNARGLADITWHGCVLDTPSWDDPNARALACTLGGMQGDETDIHIMMNMYWEPLDFAVPSVPGRHWYRALDTGLAVPDDIVSQGLETRMTNNSYRVDGRSVAVLISK
ncbi:MAG: glycogen debranching protein GlgX [Candidatus Competibacter denitrificans]